MSYGCGRYITCPHCSKRLYVSANALYVLSSHEIIYVHCHHCNSIAKVTMVVGPTKTSLKITPLSGIDKTCDLVCFSGKPPAPLTSKQKLSPQDVRFPNHVEREVSPKDTIFLYKKVKLPHLPYDLWLAGRRGVDWYLANKDGQWVYYCDANGLNLNTGRPSNLDDLEWLVTQNLL